MNSVRTDAKDPASYVVFTDERLGLLLEHSSDLIAVVDNDWIIRYHSPSSLRALGRAPEEIIGDSFFDYLHRGDRFRFEDTFDKLRQIAGSVCTLELRLSHADGSWLSARSTFCSRLANPAIRGIVITSRVRSDPGQDREALEESLSVLKATLDSTADGLLVTDRSGNIVNYNMKFTEMWGVPSSVLESRKHDAVLQFAQSRLKDPDGFLRRVSDLYRHPDDSSFDVLEFEDGRVFERYSQPQRTGNESVGRVWSFRDITDQKRSEARLKASEEKYRLLVDTSVDAVISIDSQKRIDLWNPAAKEIFGYDEEEAIGKPLSLIFSIDDQSRLVACSSSSSIEGTDSQAGRTVELIGITKEGNELPVELSISTARTRGSNITTAFIRDITERKKSQREIAWLATFPEESPNAVVRLDSRGSIIYKNRATDRLLIDFGIPKGESQRILPPSAAEICQRALSTNEDFHRIQHEVNDHIIEWVFHPAQEGSVVHAYGQDVTSVRKLEEQLHQSQKLEAVGTLAGGVAHDFNNLLTGIIGHAALLKQDTDPTSYAYETAEVIETAAHRAAKLTQQLLRFARRGKRQNIPVNMHQIIKETTALLSPTIDRRIKISRSLVAKEASILGDPDQLQNVILNISVNARDAMPDGGELIFETESLELDRTFCNMHPEAKRGPYIVISIADTGTGIPPETMNRIFEPFFTTKDLGKGTGMGLALVYGVVRDHEGLIDVETELGKGTVFKLYLPIVRSGSGFPDRDAQIEEPSSGAGRLLVVDDEEIIRKLTKRILEGLGYTVITAADGQEAVEIYKQRADEIDLAIIDLIMPRLSGGECFQALKKINTHIKVLLSTGYEPNGATAELLRDGVCGIIQKPFQVRDLAHAVARVLDG